MKMDWTLFYIELALKLSVKMIIIKSFRNPKSRFQERTESYMKK